MVTAGDLRAWGVHGERAGRAPTAESVAAPPHQASFGDGRSADRWCLGRMPWSWMLVVLCLVCAGAALAQPPYQPWQFRPMPPSNARGVPPQQATQPVAPGLAPTAPLSVPGQTPIPAEQPPSQLPQAGPGLQPVPQQMPPGTYAGAFPGQAPGAYPAQMPAQIPAQMPVQSQAQYFPQYPTQYPQQRYAPGAGPGQGAPGQYAPGQYAPSQMQSYGSRAGAARAPRLEVELTDDKPYVQENVLVRLRVVSNGNLATASPDLAGIDQVLFEKIDGPRVSTRSQGNEREIVNEFVMAMTPLRDGAMEVGPLKVTGTLAGGVPFEAVAREPLKLQVRPAMAAVRPWLPLQTLRISAEMDQTGTVERGQPVTLAVELEAQGATGEQLPSLEPMLRSPDFRVYREQTMTDTRLAANGETLIGKRIETYTLVPHAGGRLQLPELRLGWWNVETASREASSVPIRTFSVAGSAGPFGFTRSAERGGGGGWAVFWMPLAGVLLLLTGYWGGVWLRSRPSAGRSAASPRILGHAVSGGLSALRHAVNSGLRRLDPTPLVKWLRNSLAQLTPMSTRVYRCVKAADAEDDPAAWCLAFQNQACRNLRARAREPLPRMADRIVSLRPGVDRPRVLRLMQQLDTALYNRQELDFRRWKQDFRRALRPGTGAIASVFAGRVRRGRLPELNPRPAT
jgi:hypothetical protein